MARDNDRESGRPKSHDSITDEAEQGGRKPPSGEELRALRKALRALRAAWAPPAHLLKTAREKLPAGARILLADVIRVLAFKAGKPPKRPKKKSPGPIRLPAAARRMQAARALFEAAREGRVKLYGTRQSDRSSGLIEDFEFDVQLRLDTDDNAICPDLGAASLAMSDFNELRKNPSAHSWRNVTVERKSLFSWITEVSENTATAATVTEATRVAAALLRKNENISRQNAFGECRKKLPGLSWRSFQWTVWPGARERVGLPPKARPGRKPKSSREKS